LGLLLSAQVVAFQFTGSNWSYRGNPMGDNWRVCPTGIPGEGVQRTKDGARVWNYAGFTFTFGSDACLSGGTFPLLNKVNQVQVDFGGGLPANSLASTVRWFLTNAPQNTVECDMRFSNAVNWYTGTGTPGPNQFDWWSVAVHEMGHCLGLGHEDNVVPLPVMRTALLPGTSARALTPDDIAGRNAIYDVSGVLVAAVLPGSRSVQVGTPATAFATLINASTAVATGCSVAPRTSVAATFTFQTTNPATNAVTGTANTSVDIPAAQTQTFVFAFTPTAAIDPTDVELDFDCANTLPAKVTPGVNTLLLSASTTPIPDIVALAATLNNDGIVNIPGPTGTGVFSVATVNVGASATITASADTGGASLPVSLTLCATDPVTGACLASPASSVATQITANATPTFGVFVTATESVTFDPARNRIVVRFVDSGRVTRGATSVAVRTQ